MLCVAAALLCLASAAAADVNVRILDKDPNSGVLSTTMGFNVKTNGGVAKGTPWSWNSASSTDILSVDMPDVDFFKQHVPNGMTGGVFVEVWAKGELKIYDSFVNSADYQSLKPTSALASKPKIIVRDSKNALLPLGAAVREKVDPNSGIVSVIYATYDFQNNNGVMLLEDANGKVIKIVCNSSGSDYIMFKFPTDGDLVFPLKFYLVVYKNASVITASAGAGGTIDPSGEYLAEADVDTSYNITANEDSIISSVVVDGEPVTVTDRVHMSYTFPAVSTDHTIAVSFDKAAACSGATARLAGVVEDEDDASVAALKSSGYTTGGKDVTLVSGDMTATGTFAADRFVQGAVLDVDYTNANGEALLTLWPLSGAFSETAEYHAVLLNKNTNLYEVLPAALDKTAGTLSVRVKPVGAYFSTNTVYIYEGKATATSEWAARDTTPVVPDTDNSVSGSGCNAGLAVLALLALVPLLDRRKK